jgi:hypothetical protein
VTYPGYQSLYELAEAQGCALSHWEPRLTEPLSCSIRSSSTTGGQTGQKYRQFKFDLKDLEVRLGGWGEEGGGKNPECFA